MNWQLIDTAPERGTFLGFLEAEFLGSRFHVCRWSPNAKIVGGYFHFDAPKVTHWMPLPEPPAEAL